MPRKTDPNATVPTPSAGKPKQIPAAPDRTQTVEERLRSGQMEKAIARTKKEMDKAARDLDFMEAARLRDEMFALQKQLQEMKG